MYIEEIEWLDKEGKEAILKVVNDTKSLMCFSCPCSYNIGDFLTYPLECLQPLLPAMPPNPLCGVR